MISRWNRWGPLGGLLLCITWSPMAIAIPRLPDLDSARDVQAFWRSNQELMQGVILSVSVGFLFLLVFLGALVELVRTPLVFLPVKPVHDDVVERDPALAVLRHHA